jgi:hypothetical protein
VGGFFRRIGFNTYQQLKGAKRMQQQQLPFEYPRYTRHERQEQAMAIIERGRGITLLALAHTMGLRKTPYLRGLVDDLVEMGLVTVINVSAGFPIPTKLYCPVYGPNGDGK